MDRDATGCDPDWRYHCVANHHRFDAGSRMACIATLPAPRLVYRWHRHHGWSGATTAEFVSFPGRLDFTALDSRHRTGITSAGRRIGAKTRLFATHLAPTQRAPMGSRALLDDYLRHAPAAL